MSKLLLGWENHALAGTITASASAAGLGPEQMQNPHGATSTAWTTPSSTTSANFVVDAGASVEWHAFGLFNTNLSTAATVRWRVGDDPTFAAHAYDSGTLSNTVAAGYRQSLHIPPAAQTGQYLRVDLADSGNAEGRLRVAQLYAGRAVRPVRNLGFESAVARDVQRPSLTTRGGQEFPTFRFARRSWRVELPSLALADVSAVAEAMQIAAQDGGNVLFVPFPAGADVAREAVFGTVTTATPIGWPGQTPKLRTFGFTISERL